MERLHLEGGEEGGKSVFGDRSSGRVRCHGLGGRSFSSKELELRKMHGSNRSERDRSWAFLRRLNVRRRRKTCGKQIVDRVLRMVETKTAPRSNRALEAPGGTVRATRLRAARRGVSRGRP